MWVVQTCVHLASTDSGAPFTNRMAALLSFLWHNTLIIFRSLVNSKPATYTWAQSWSASYHESLLLDMLEVVTCMHECWPRQLFVHSSLHLSMSMGNIVYKHRTSTIVILTQEDLVCSERYRSNQTVSGEAWLTYLPQFLMPECLEKSGSLFAILRSLQTVLISSRMSQLLHKYMKSHLSCLPYLLILPALCTSISCINYSFM